MQRVIYTIHYTGNLADKHELDFYDAAHALVGFQRSLALTAHLVANGEIITQAPSLKEAKIYSLPPEEGGWKTRAALIFGTMFGGMSVAPHDTVAGNIATSIYDYILSESVGAHIDYNKTIQQMIDSAKAQHPSAKLPTREKLDSLVEKCEVAITEMHRPIVKSETAASARILVREDGADHAFGPELSLETYDYIRFTSRSEIPSEEIARISGYDTNTFKGRAYLAKERRPIPFELSVEARSQKSIQIVTDNLAANAQGRYSEIRFIAFRDLSRTGRLKKLHVVEVIGR